MLLKPPVYSAHGQSLHENREEDGRVGHIDKDIVNVVRQILLRPDRQRQRKSALQCSPGHQRHELAQAVIARNLPSRHQRAHEHARRAGNDKYQDRQRNHDPHVLRQLDVEHQKADHYEQDRIQNALEDLPEIVVILARVHDLHAPFDLIHLIGEIHSADNRRNYAGKAQMLADHVHERHIEQRDQDVPDRIAREPHQPEQQKRHGQCHRNGAQDLTPHQHKEIAAAAVLHDRPYENEQRNACAVVEEGLILNDRADALRKADLVQDARCRDRVRRTHHAAQQHAGPDVHRNAEQVRNQVKQATVNERRKHGREQRQQADRTEVLFELAHIDLARAREEHEAQHAVHQVLFEAELTEPVDKARQGSCRQHSPQHHEQQRDDHGKEDQCDVALEMKDALVQDADEDYKA